MSSWPPPWALGSDLKDLNFDTALNLVARGEVISDSLKDISTGGGDASTAFSFADPGGFGLSLGLFGEEAAEEAARSLDTALTAFTGVEMSSVSLRLTTSAPALTGLGVFGLTRPYRFL